MVLSWTPSLRYRHQFSSDATPYPPATNPKEVQLMFEARLYVFDPISRQPTDADLTGLRKELTTIFLPLPYDVEKELHNLLGLVMDKEDYKRRYRAKFATP